MYDAVPAPAIFRWSVPGPSLAGPFAGSARGGAHAKTDRPRLDPALALPVVGSCALQAPVSMTGRALQAAGEEEGEDEDGEECQDCCPACHSLHDRNGNSRVTAPPSFHFPSLPLPHRSIGQITYMLRPRCNCRVIYFAPGQGLFGCITHHQIHLESIWAASDI